MRKNKKSQLFVIFVYVLGIIMIGLTVMVLMGPMKNLFDRSVTDADSQDADMQQFYVRSKTIWIWLPIALIFPMIAWAFSKSHEREGYG
jgi:hypothetical protein